MTTHSWLKELQALGVQLSTDGVNLTINAPRGVMTPALWEQLRSHKQELITQIVSTASSQDEDEHLYAFARAVSCIVDVLGGPDQVRITKHVKGLTLAQYARTIRPAYQPRALPDLPRLVCPRASPVHGARLHHRKDRL
jgi:TubC N-terminal docking domain